MVNSRDNKRQNTSPTKLLKIAGSQPTSPKSNLVFNSPEKKSLNFKQTKEPEVPIYEEETAERRVSLCIINNEGK